MRGSACYALGGRGAVFGSSAGGFRTLVRRLRQPERRVRLRAWCQRGMGYPARICSAGAEPYWPLRLLSEIRFRGGGELESESVVCVHGP